MQAYLHRYEASAFAEGSSNRVSVSGAQLPTLETTSPPQFGGPQGVWSPETLLCGAVADCFVLTFRGVARAARFDWHALECRVEGILERVDRNSQFRRFTTKARVTVPRGGDPEKARSLLEQAEQRCLIANSLRGARHLEAEVLMAEHTEAADAVA